MLQSELPGLYQDLCSVASDDDMEAGMQAVEEWKEQHNFDIGDQKRLDHYAHRVVLARISSRIPFVETPLTDGRREFVEHCNRLEPHINRSDLPTHFDDYASSMTESYTAPRVDAVLDQLTAQELLACNLFGRESMNFYLTVRYSDYSGSEFIENLARNWVQVRVQHSMFGASKLILKELLHRNGVLNAREFKQATEMHDYVASAAFSATILRLSQYPIAIVQKNSRHGLLLDDMFDDTPSVEGMTYDSYPAGCPAGRLIKWAPRFLFAAHDVAAERYTHE